MVSGFLFLFIIITNLASGRFGYETFSDLDSEAKLQKISNDQKKFKIATVLILIEHVSIIALALTLFIAFSPYNIVLAVVWAVARTGEGLIQIYNKESYWELLKIAREYAGTDGTEKNALIDLVRSILRTKNTVFTLAQILFSIGTLAYSILFATYGVVPEIIGWLGIVASILYGFGSGIVLVKPNLKALWGIGGLLILIFEIVLGGWLLFSTLI
jgi:endonuclease V-like protein UPF0215 family